MEKDELEGELKYVCEEKDITVSHTKNINWQYDILLEKYHTWNLIRLNNRVGLII